MAHLLCMASTQLCLSLMRSHCLFISIHLPPSHIALIVAVAVVAVTLLSPSPLPLPPHKLSPLPSPPLPPSPLRRLLPLPSPVGCCLSRVPIYPSITMSQSRFLQEEYSKRSARQQTKLQSMLPLLTWLQQERSITLMEAKG